MFGFDKSNNRYAKDDDDAQKRFLKYKSKDPFPSILPALLNSADISDYIAATGMVHPFHIEELKSGSYEAKILGSCIYWKPDGEKTTKILNSEADLFDLEPNSIAFVQVEPKFRLPDYIALRFNLKITHVHRGLLLGTGPLIDPGFEGKILIPLHNLTDNCYTFRGKEGLIWIEFTKLSPNPDDQNDSSGEDHEKRCGQYVPFPEDKKNKKPYYYFEKANNNEPIISSIPKRLEESEKKAETAEVSASSAESAVKDLVSTYRKWGFLASVGIGVAIASIIIGALTLVLSIKDNISEINEELINEKSNQEQLNSNVERLKEEVANLRDQVKELSIIKEKFVNQNLNLDQQLVEDFEINSSDIDSPIKEYFNFSKD